MTTDPHELPDDDAMIDDDELDADPGPPGELGDLDDDDVDPLEFRG